VFSSSVRKFLAPVAQRPGSADNSTRAIALYWGAVAVALVLAAPLLPQVSAGMPPCFFRSLTGFPCPACGATRAALALSRFDLLAAWVSNPLVTIGYLFFLAGGLLAGGAALAGKPLPEPKRFSPALRATAWTAAMLNWLYLLIRFRTG
jgi:Protein of unknown function (DUF2752)